MTDTEQNKYALSSWGAQKLQDLEVPSGQLCQVRPAGIQQLLGAGVLDSADTLTSLIDEKHIKRTQTRKTGTKGAKPAVKNNQLQNADGSTTEIDTDSLLNDPEKLQKVFSLIDKVAEHMVVQPDVKRPVKLDENGKEVALPAQEREDGVVYTDMIELQDKMFLFQYAVGGDTDLESFRNRFSEGVASVAAE